MSITLFCYLWSFLFKNPETVIRATSLIIQLIALVPAILVMILSNISDSTRNASYTLHYIFCAIGNIFFLVQVPIFRPSLYSNWNVKLYHFSPIASCVQQRTCADCWRLFPRENNLCTNDYLFNTHCCFFWYYLLC